MLEQPQKTKTVTHSLWGSEDSNPSLAWVILETELTGMADGWGMLCEKKRGIEDDFGVLPGSCYLLKWEGCRLRRFGGED